MSVNFEINNKKNKNLLLINGFWTSISMIDEILSDDGSDSNIYLTFPFGIMTIAAWCKQELIAFNIEVLDLMMELHKYISNPDMQRSSFKQLLVKCLKKIFVKPDYIGISFNSSNGHNSNLELAKICKDIWPKSIIIVGGTHATTFTHRIINSAGIDYVLRGTGDTAFIELINSLENGESPDEIKGVVSGCHNLTSKAPIFEDLDSIPPYPYELIDMEYLVINDEMAPIFDKNSRTGVIITSRGCPFSCTYCAANQIHGKKVQFKSIDNVIREIEILIKTYNVNQLAIIDDLFGLDKKLFFKFFEKIKAKNLNFKIIIPAGLSIKIYDEKMIDVLIDFGLDAVYFPLESGSEYVQNNIIKKRIDLEKAKRLILYTKSKDIFTGINIVIGSPGETKKHMMETYEFIKSLPVDWVAFFSAYPYPGTAMTNILLERGDITEEKLMTLWDSSSQGFKKRTFDTKEITGSDLGDLVYDFNIKLNFINNYNMRIRNYGKIIPKLNKIIERFPFHIVALACRAKCFKEQDLEEQYCVDKATIKSLIKQNSKSKEMFDRYSELIQSLNI